MPTLDLDALTSACTAGGPSCLTSTTELVPAGGVHASVAPARYLEGSGSQAHSVYAYEKRFLGGELRSTALIDSKQSQLNRVEEAIAAAVRDEAGVWARLPHVRVTYEDRAFTDLTLPHRIFDGHIRAGSVDGTPTTQVPAYRAVRDASPDNARALLDMSPVTLIFGGWDSSRKARQGRWRSALVGEIVGFLADDNKGEPVRAGKRGGARVDPVGMQVQLDSAGVAAVLDPQAAEYSPATVETIRKESKKASSSAPWSASPLGLGGIPPALSQLAGVACDRILRTHVLSFATLRQMRFGAGVDGDAACRSLLAAVALAGLARSDAELVLRANCDLREAGPTALTVDQRGGQLQAFDALTLDVADALLADALANAEQAAGVRWNGLVLDVVGNPAITAGAVADDGDEK